MTPVYKYMLHRRGQCDCAILVRGRHKEVLAVRFSPRMINAACAMLVHGSYVQPLANNMAL